jgi:hypothetical protein
LYSIERKRSRPVQEPHRPSPGWFEADVRIADGTAWIRTSCHLSSSPGPHRNMDAVDSTVCNICTVACFIIRKERDILRYAECITCVRGYYPSNVDRFSARDPWRTVVYAIMYCTFGFRKIVVCSTCNLKHRVECKCAVFRCPLR